MAAIVWAVREPAGNWTHYLDDGRLPVHVIHGTDGAGDLDVADYEVRRVNRTGFNKVMLTACYVRRLGWKTEQGKVVHDGTYVYDR